jgi:DNA-binding CsgD family transcriptional regulator
MSTQLALALPASTASTAVVINGRATLRIEGEQRVVVVAGLPVHHYGVGDEVAEAYAMVFLVDSGFAQQHEVARAFGCSVRTVRRHQRRYAEGGMAALATRSGWRAGRRRVASKRMRVVERLKAEGVGNREIARRLGVTEKAIRKLVGPSLEGKQEVLPSVTAQASAPTTATSVSLAAEEPPSPSEPSPSSVTSTSEDSGGDASRQERGDNDEEPVPMSLDVDASNRSFDRLLACFGLLDDAAPVFASARSIASAGVLVAIPALVESAILVLARKLYGEIGPAFYGLRTTILVLLVMALLRLNRPEHLKEHDPAVLGRLLGLDRAPEVKTLRRKLTRLAAYHRAEQLGAELARHRVDKRGQVVGFLYVDGHVRAYHGKRTLPKAFVTTRRLAMPATTDYWVNDSVGDPLLVLTATANAGLAKMLPAVLAQVRAVVGARRVTVVFDRGGYSPKLFAEILAHGFDLLTYRKGKARRITERRFLRRRAKLDDRWVSYELDDRAVRLLKGKLRLRQVTRQSEDGHQTQVLTSRWDLRDIEVAYRMFERWRQENFFKYMRQEFLLDALVDYQIEPDDPTRTVPNPERRALDKDIHAARVELAKLEQRFGAAAADNPEGHRPTMRGFKIAHGQLGTQLRSARKRLSKLIDRRRDLPHRVEVQDTSQGAVIKLATERKHLSNILKMVAYQAESDLVAMLKPHYARAEEEGRTLIHELLHAAADLAVTDSELRVTLHPLSSPHRTLAAKALCEQLDATATIFPGSRLRLRFDVPPPPLRGLAFPGPRTSADNAVAASQRAKPDTSTSP